jgi:hypothetical protein
MAFPPIVTESTERVYIATMELWQWITSTSSLKHFLHLFLATYWGNLNLTSWWCLEPNSQHRSFFDYKTFDFIFFIVDWFLLVSGTSCIVSHRCLFTVLVPSSSSHSSPSISHRITTSLVFIDNLPMRMSFFVSRIKPKKNGLYNQTSHVVMKVSLEGNAYPSCQDCTNWWLGQGHATTISTFGAPSLQSTVQDRGVSCSSQHSIQPHVFILDVYRLEALNLKRRINTYDRARTPWTRWWTKTMSTSTPPMVIYHQRFSSKVVCLIQLSFKPASPEFSEHS